MRNFTFAAALLMAACAAAAAQTPAPSAAPAMRPVGMAMTSTDFQSGNIIADEYTGKVNIQGQPPKAVSPQLSWTGTPTGTQSFVMIMHDLDVMVGKGTGDNLHWLAFNIPGTATSLPRGTIQPRNRTSNGYSGPGAPAPIYHHYVFSIWALDSKLNLTETATRDDVMRAMDGHVLDKAHMVARFHR